MVATHPKRPGRHVLAIECDGASYHSAPIARERDRLRQEILERLGWRFHRIWSTDWWNQRELEVERALAAFESACEAVVGEGAAESNRTPPLATLVESVEEASSPTLRRTDQRPAFTKGLPITEYDFKDLVKLAKYIRSDKRLYTNAELVDLMAKELGKRKGSRVVEVLSRAARASQ